MAACNTCRELFELHKLAGDRLAEVTADRSYSEAALNRWDQLHAVLFDLNREIAAHLASVHGIERKAPGRAAQAAEGSALPRALAE